MMRIGMLLATLVFAAMASETEAQTFVGAGGPVSLTPGTYPAMAPAPTASLYPSMSMETIAPGGLPVVTGTGGAPAYASWYVNPVFGLSVPLVNGAYYPPYDYFAAGTYPARFYAGGYSNDFPFYGQPYGNPSTPWTWATMSTYGNPGSYYSSRFNPW